mgnify:CR=1 FL=1
MSQSNDILKGNYKIPDVEQKIEKPEDKQDSLEQEFEAKALKALGGSITFVKKKGSFIWKGEDKQ